MVEQTQEQNKQPNVREIKEKARAEHKREDDLFMKIFTGNW